MFTIDLLKGRNLPEKGGWREMAIAYAAMSILIVCAIVVSRGYFTNKKTMIEQEQIVNAYELRLKEMQGDKALADSIVSDSRSIRASLVDVGSALRRQVQWSDMLLAINDSLVDSLNINKLDVTVRKVQRAVPQKGDPNKKINISVPARTLVVSLFSHVGGNGDEAIRKFQKKLLKTEPFKKYVREIVIALREPDTIDGREVIRYELNCIFKVREL